jgi:hypothetical protein
VNKMLHLSGRDKLSLAQMLEAGSWKVLDPCHPASGVVANKVQTGRTRNCRGLAAEHQRTPDHDPLRRNRFLIRYPPLSFCFCCPAFVRPSDPSGAESNFRARILQLSIPITCRWVFWQLFPVHIFATKLQHVQRRLLDLSAEFWTLLLLHSPITEEIRIFWILTGQRVQEALL